MNKFKKEKVKNVGKSNTDKTSKETKKVSRSLVALFSGNFLSSDNVARQLPFIFFLTFLGILYIANGYYAQSTVRELQKVGNELKALRSEYITIKSDLNYKSKQSQVAQSAKQHGIIESTTPPIKIKVTQEEMEKIKVKE